MHYPERPATPHERLQIDVRNHSGFSSPPAPSASNRYIACLLPTCPGLKQLGQPEVIPYYAWANRGDTLTALDETENALSPDSPDDESVTVRICVPIVIADTLPGKFIVAISTLGITASLLMLMATPLVHSDTPRPTRQIRICRPPINLTRTTRPSDRIRQLCQGVLAQTLKGINNRARTSAGCSTRSPRRSIPK